MFMRGSSALLFAPEVSPRKRRDGATAPAAVEEPRNPSGKAMPSVITEQQRPQIPVAGTSDTFPVRRVYCVGRNYAAHAREMGGDPTREPPFFFMKPSDTVHVVPEGKTVDHPYPSQSKDYHFEIELVAFLSRGGKDIPVEKALDCVYGYAVGLDMTRRDLQQQAKDLRRPWELGKGADNSGPVGPIHPVAKIGHPAKGAISLTVDGQVKQKADLSDMIWSVAEQVSYLSTYFELKPGDVIFAGTPEGVGKVERGQTMVGAIEGLGGIRLKVV
jgi:fumarylpyruvate hydrolase